MLRPEDGTTVVDAFDLDAVKHVESPGRKVETILERTQNYCFILSYVDFPVAIDYETITVGNE
jgi:hypothetical protein